MNVIQVTVPSTAVVSADTILVIDDDSAIRETLTDILLTFLPGVVVCTAADGHEGVQIFKQNWQSINLILLDMNMPVMNGEQTYQKLQQIAPDVKVIVSTSLSQDEAQTRFGEQLLPAFLQKPYNTDTLLHVVKMALAFV